MGANLDRNKNETFESRKMEPMGLAREIDFAIRSKTHNQGELLDGSSFSRAKFPSENSKWVWTVVAMEEESHRRLVQFYRLLFREAGGGGGGEETDNQAERRRSLDCDPHSNVRSVHSST